MTAAPVVQPSVGAKLLRVAAIALVFATLGPAIGGCSMIVLIAIVKLGFGVGVSGLATIALFAMIYGVLMAYLIGIIPAAVVGLIVAIRQVYFGRVSWQMALGIGVLAGAAFTLFVVSGRPEAADGLSNEAAGDFAELPAILMLTCVLPTMVCWALVRRWYLPQAAPGATS